jgi:hypothetical protein
MFPDYHLPYKSESRLQPDRRPLPQANEIRMRVKRILSKRAAQG